MAAPTFVGAGTAAYGSSDSWPSSLLIGSGNVPSGVTNNDRLILFVSVYYQQDLFPAVDDTLGSFGGLDGWTAIPKAQLQVTGTGSNTFWQLWAYTIRYVDATFPLTIVPTGFTSGVAYVPSQRALNDNYRAQLFAWAPSHVSGDTADSNASTGGGILPASAPSVTVNDNDGLVVAAGALPAIGAIGAFSTARSFTEQYHQAAITGRGGSLKVADYAPGLSGTYTSPQWNKDTGAGRGGVSLLIALNEIESFDQWGMNTVRW